MNTKILLAIASAVALSACSNSKKPDPSTSQWEFPLMEPAGARGGRPSGVRPVAPTISSPTDFRVPDVTGNLPDIQNRPSPRSAPRAGGPLSASPPSPPLAPTPAPEIVPAPEVTPGPELSPAPEVTPLEGPTD